MKKLSKKQVLTFLKEYGAMTLAGLLNAVSLFTFVNPATLIPGGFSGLASSLSYVFTAFLDVSYDTLMSLIYFGLNVPLLICSLIFLRGDFTFKTIWATVVSTVVLGVLPESFKFHDSRLISTIFGGIMIGFAMFLAAENNGSNGGTEIIARIVAKFRPEVDISKVLLVANFAITLSGSVIVMIVVPGTHIDIILYSLVYVIMGANIFGVFKRGLNHPQKFLIITTKFEEISQDITETFHRGFSVMDLEKSRDGDERKMISVIVQHRQTPKLKQIIRQHDPHAFTIVKEIYDMFSRPNFNRSYKKNEQK